ncbi:dihydrofolate reductase family protein [Kribbella catacumbae]|uniref:dihydrofolate reductase family protein n=1 Tax=Kribbella catacumbae TaxID=460086 RepID=UPI00036197BF|nr:dihydrofolate reductase family protein [Kribbella catacumbae]
MRKLIESTFVTLDGIVSTPEKWSAPYWDEEHTDYASSLLREADALVLGRRTYDNFAGSWPLRSGDWYTDKMNSMPKHVATHSPSDLSWNATVLEGDPIESVAALKELDGGHLLKFGTGEFSKSLLTAGLVDEYHFWIFPAAAGTGDRLFDGLGLTHFHLVATTPLKSGITIHRLVPNH